MKPLRGTRCESPQLQLTLEDVTGRRAGLLLIALFGAALLWTASRYSRQAGEPTAPVARDAGSDSGPVTLQFFRAPKAAPALSTTDLDGRDVVLASFRGKVVLINFWATWCVPCLLEMPAMDRLNRRLGGRAFRMLAINQGESLEEIQRFAQGRGFTFELVLDPDGTVGGNYGANRLPITYIIDHRGMVIRRAIGPRAWDSAEAMDFFGELIAQAARDGEAAAGATAQETGR
jgi:peroxiredoxin